MLATSQEPLAVPPAVRELTETRYPILNRPPAVRPEPVLVDAACRQQRQEIEQFIHDVFARAWQADIHHFLPVLIGIHESNGECVAAAGLQPAANGALYLEKYLDRPVDEILGNMMQQKIDRQRIIEAGNLAVTSRGGARHLITATLTYLYNAGYQWAVFTAVPVLINSFRKLGLPLTKLADADPRRLGDDAAQWGDYYQSRPMVMAGHIPTGFYMLQQRKLQALHPARRREQRECLATPLQVIHTTS